MSDAVDGQDAAAKRLRERCAEVRHVGTGPISDATEKLGLPRRLILGMTLVAEDQSTAIVGPVYTVRQVDKPRTEAHDSDLTRQRYASSQFAQPGDVIFIDCGGHTDFGTWGQGQALMSQSRGVVGLVVYGAIRDREGVRETGFPVLCQGFSPISSKWGLATDAMNEPLIVNGFKLFPGDVVYGDVDGLIVIAPDHVDAVFDLALKIFQSEEKARIEKYGFKSRH